MKKKNISGSVGWSERWGLLSLMVIFWHQNIIYPTQDWSSESWRHWQVENILLSPFFLHFLFPDFKCTRLCVTKRACLYFIQKFFICKTWKPGEKSHVFQPTMQPWHAVFSPGPGGLSRYPSCHRCRPFNCSSSTFSSLQAVSGFHLCDAVKWERGGCEDGTD